MSLVFHLEVVKTQSSEGKEEKTPRAFCLRVTLRGVVPFQS